MSAYKTSNYKHELNNLWLQHTLDFRLKRWNLNRKLLGWKKQQNSAKHSLPFLLLFTVTSMGNSSHIQTLACLIYLDVPSPDLAEAGLPHLKGQNILSSCLGFNSGSGKLRCFVAVTPASERERERAGGRSVTWDSLLLIMNLFIPSTSSSTGSFLYFFNFAHLC